MRTGRTGTLEPPAGPSLTRSIGTLRESRMSHELPSVYLARHGETAWTLSHQHTGRSDIPLTARGEANATSLGERLRGVVFERVLTSPLGTSASHLRAGRLPRSGRRRSGPDGMGLRRVRRADDGRDPPQESRLVALPRRLPRRRVGRAGRRPRRSRDRAAASDCRKAARSSATVIFSACWRPDGWGCRPIMDGCSI